MTTSKGLGNVFKLQRIINVRDPAYGAKGDGTTDDAAAIQLADTAAAAAGAILYFPRGTYAVDITTKGSSLAITTSWVGEGDVTIQRKDFTASTAYYIAQMTTKSNLTLAGIVFDGQITKASSSTANEDLGTAGSYSDTGTEALWRKSYGVQLFNCSNISISNCGFKNFLRAGLRINGDGYATTISSNIRMYDCWTSRTRGVYGDGFYFGGVTDLKVSDCHVYDYQRIGFVLEFAATDAATDCRDVEYVNCTADYGHDAVSPESNAGFWTECGDNVQHTNCTAKRTAIGFLCNAVSVGDTGTTRSWTAPLLYTNCASLKTQQAMRAAFGGTRSVQLTVAGFYGESNAATSGSALNAPTYAYEALGGVGAIQLAFDDVTSGVNLKATFRDVKLHMIDRALALGVGTEYGAFRLIQGNVATAQQFELDIDGMQFQWSKTDGTDDVNAKTLYRTSTVGHYGDIVFGGYHDAGSANDYRFKGHATIRKCSNHTFGYVMATTEITGGSINVIDSKISIRGSMTSTGDLYMTGCQSFDFRGDLGFTQAQISNSSMIDLNSASTDRTAWGPSWLVASGVTFFRQLHLQLAGGDTTHRKYRANFSGCYFDVSFQLESGLKLSQGAGLYAHVQLAGCIFRNIPTGSMDATDSMIEMNWAAGTVCDISGAGNTFDSAMVTAGGHVCQITTGPTYNDAPQTVASPFLTVFGVLAVFEPI